MAYCSGSVAAMGQGVLQVLNRGIGAGGPDRIVYVYTAVKWRRSEPVTTTDKGCVLCASCAPVCCLRVFLLPRPCTIV